MITDATVDLGYKIEETQEGALVSFRGDGLSPFALTVRLFLSVLLVFFYGVGVLFLMLVAFQQSTRTRRQEFIMGEDSIFIRGKRYKLAEISQVELTNDSDKNSRLVGRPAYGVIVGGTGIAGATAGAMANTTVQMASMVEGSIAKRSFRVSIRYGKDAIVIGRYLSEGKALSIFQLFKPE